LLLEEYGVTFAYLAGEKNVAEDALFHLDVSELKTQGEETLTFFSESVHSNMVMENNKLHSP
jgi:hypothetical protein